MMKNILLLLIVCPFAFACNNANKSNESKSDKAIISQRLIKYLDSSGTGRFLFSSGRLKVDMEKIYEVALTVKIKVYKDEKLSQELQALEVKKAGGTTTTIELPNPDRPDFPIQKDTFVAFNPKDMKALFALDKFNYGGGGFSGNVETLAIALTNKSTIPGMNTEFFTPIFFVKSSDLELALGKEEAEFLSKFLFNSLSVSESQTNLEL